MVGRQYPHEPPRQPSHDDKLHAEQTKAAADGLTAQLRQLNTARPIRTLKRAEIENLAAGAITGYTLKIAEQEAAERNKIANANLFI